MSRRRARLAAALAVVLALHVPLPAGATSDERELGRRFFLSSRADLPLVEDPAVVEYVNGLGQRLVKTLGSQSFDYHFFVVQHPSVNAFAVPGGYVFVFTGLLARASTEDELVGVLAHEIAHVDAHHIVRQQSQGQAWGYAALLGALLATVNPVLGAGAIAAAQTAQLSYSREFEQEADYMGLRHATDAGFDPHALGGFFKQLLAERRLNPTGVPPYMLTHPMTEARVSHVDSIIDAQKLTTPPGRPLSTPGLREAQAVSRAASEPSDLVIADYRRLAEEHPDDAEHQFLLGRVYQTVGQLEAARTALERGRDLGGLGDRVDLPLGSVYNALGEHDKARGVVEHYLERHPADGWARLELGKALAAGDENAALTEFQRAIQLEPDLDEAHRLAGMALGRRGEQAEGFYHLALASRLRGDLPQALSHFERTNEFLTEGSPRQLEVKEAIEELRPLVREMRDQQRGRRGARP